MHVRIALASLLLAGCIDDRYTCSTDADCDLGDAGRCEIDHACSAHDASCPSGRRYSPHSGAESGTCFDDHAAILDLCAPGQAPPLADACTTSICATLPACCETGWTEACVQLAQIEPACDLTCDTQIAITANRGNTVETWTLTWSGSAWTGEQVTGSLVSWLAPAPGTATPRLATVDPTQKILTVDDGTTITVAATRDLIELTSVDFDRDGRDTLAIGYLDTQAPATDNVAIIKLDDGSIRELGPLGSSQRLSWGDYDHDAFPDAIGGFGGRYAFYDNAEPPDDTHVRILNNAGVHNMPNNALGALVPGLRSIDWTDFDNDGVLDAVAFGSAVHVHLGANILDPNADDSIDCDPPSGSCMDVPGDISLAGATVADPVQTQMLVSVDAVLAPALATRNLYRFTAGTLAAPVALAFSPAACGTPCQPIHAVVVRDLDGDHQLDFVAIDAQLGVFVALSGSGGLSQLVELPDVLPTLNNPTLPFTSIRVSVTGAPR